MPEFWTKREKLAWLDENVERAGQQNALNTVEWETLAPDNKHTWLIPEHSGEFTDFLTLGSKETKSSRGNEAEAIFKIYSLGVATNRDDLVYGFELDKVNQRAEIFVEIYNRAVDSMNRPGISNSLENLIDTSDSRIKWTRQVKRSLEKREYSKFDNLLTRNALYRPFTRKHLYFDDFWNEEQYKQHLLFPTPNTEQENLVISFSGIGHDFFCCLIANCIVDLKYPNIGNGGNQCFPFYVYNADGSNRRENITDWALGQFRAHYGDESISKWDIFYYVYGLLHHPGYRERYADNLKRELPRIPFVPSPPNPLSHEDGARGSQNAADMQKHVPTDAGEGEEPHPQPLSTRGEGSQPVQAGGFWAFCEAGKRLAELHLNYETVKPYPLEWVTKNPVRYRVEKMKLRNPYPPGPLSPYTEKGGENAAAGAEAVERGYKAYSELVVNDTLTMKGIPAAVFDYRLGNRSALEWVIDQYQVSEDKRSGIVSDPNGYSADERYIVDLVERVVRVSVETVNIVAGLKGLAFR